MHHFVFPQKDTYITNQSQNSNKNFGLTEILRVGTSVIPTRITYPTKTYTYTSMSVANWCVTDFSGLLATSSITGTSSLVVGTIFNTGTDSLAFTTSLFSGSFIGDYNGYVTGSPISASNVTASFVNFSGSISTHTSSMNGYVSGTLLASSNFVQFNGTVSHLEGRIVYGFIISGSNTIPAQNIVTQEKKYTYRSLLQFDLTAISKSVALGDIQSPKFKLFLYSAKAENLPLSYSVYALPISQSWEMGDGYASDGGSSKGASWDYKDLSSASVWYPKTDTIGVSPIDFIAHPDQSTGSFARGGATWYTNSLYVASQSFNYQSADVSMDVTAMAYAWLSSSIPNNGLIVLCSDEFASTGSDMRMSFFSRDTNTIYIPHLDVSWNDAQWVTGSVFTSSIDTFASSGSILMTFLTASVIGVSVNVNLSGSFISGSYIAGNGITGSVSVRALNSLISGSVITSSISASYLGGSVEGVFLNGLLAGAYFTGSTGISASFIVLATGSYIVGGSTISGSTNNLNQVNVQLTGNLVRGPIEGIYNNGQFTGVITNGAFIGVFVTGSLSGSYATSSVTTTVMIGSSSLIPVQFNTPFFTTIQQLPNKLKSNSIVRVNIFARQEFPLKTFQRDIQLTQYITPLYLPSASFYALKDNETEQIVLDFDNYTQISCDVNGNYFLLDTSGLPQERYFKILLKTEQSGSVYIIDKDDIFKIVR